VINRGFSGYNTTVGKLLLPKIFSDESLKNVAGVIILFGSNDAAVEEPHKKTQHVPLEEFRKNLGEMVLFLTVGRLMIRLID
jgi:lysophospholipase L1-like esterase